MKNVLKILFGLVLGILLGLIAASCATDFLFSFYTGHSVLAAELLLFACFGYEALLFLAGIVCHEAGHLVFGLMSGYSFMSFRVLSLTIIRIDGKLSLKRSSVAGTAGQCLLKPPAWTEQGIPVQLYNLGGVIINAVLAAVLLPLQFVIEPGTFAFMTVRFFGLVNLYLLLTNALPVTHNDGRNALQLHRNPAACRAFWAQLMIAAMVAEGTSPAELPDELYDLPEDADMEDSMVLSIAVQKANRLICSGQHDEANAAMNRLIEEHGKRLHPIDRFFLNCERLWYELMHENRPEVISVLCDKEFMRYCRAMKTNPSVIRVNYTRALAEGKRDEADRQRKLFEKTAGTYPYKKEIEEERKYLALAESQFDK